MTTGFQKDIQYYKFCGYGFFKNLRFFDAFIILFFLEKGITYFQIGTLYAIREIIINVFEIPTGVIADAFGRRRSMVLSFASYIVSFIVLYLFSDYYLFIIAFVFYAIGDAFRTGTHKAMIFEYLRVKGWEKYKVHYYGHTRSWSQFGSAISSLVAMIIVFYSGNYTSIFLYSVIPYIIDLFLMISYPKILDGEAQKFEFKMIKQTFKHVVRSFLTSIKNLLALKAITNLSVYSGYYKAVKDYIQPVLKTLALSLPVLSMMEDKKKSAIFIGVVYFFIYFLTSRFSRNAGKISQRFSSLIQPMNITLILGGITGVVVGVFYNYQFYWLALFFFVLVYIVENVRKPIGVSCISGMFEKKILATVLSAESQAQTLFAALMAVAIGFLADKFGIGISMAIVSAGLILVYPLIRLKEVITANK